MVVFQNPLQEVRECWDLSSFQLIRKMVNSVYLAKEKEKEYILRLTPRAFRNKDEIEVELDWVRELKAGVFPVAVPVLSHLCNSFEDLGEYFAVVFEKVPGRPLIEDELTPMFYREFGKRLAQVHRVSQKFLPSSKRHDWEDQIESMIAEYDGDPEPLKTLSACKEIFLSFTQNWEEYGLVHADFHMGNFHIHQNKLFFFDFEDCCYHWYAYDIAVALLHFLHDTETQNWEVSIDEFQNEFLLGYLMENPLSAFWQRQIPLFMKFRTALVYCWAYTFLKNNQVNKKAKSELKSWVGWMHEKAIKELPL